MERKSPARSGRSGPSAMCACEIFSTTVCPISVTSNRAVSLEQLHQFGYTRLFLQVPDRIHHAAAGFARHYWLGECLKLLFNFSIGQRISLVALGIVELRGEFTSVDGVNPDDHALQGREDLLDFGIGDD